MLVGGLNVSTTQLCKEWFTIGSLVCSINSSSNAALSGTMLAVSYSAALLCSGRSWTNRWPITFPLVPLAAIQLVRICSLCDERLGLVSKWCSAYSWNSVGRVSSNLLVLIAAILSMLFPALRLPHIRGPYRVGVIDLFLPVNMPKPDSFSNTPTRNGIADQERTSGELQLSNYQQYTTARIFYPTFDSERRTMPYLDDEMAPLLCNALMKFGAPSPLKCAGWLLHTWRQIRIPAARNAPMLPFQARKTQLSNRDDSCQGKKLQGWPVAVYSHGWKGNAATYSFMGLSLAANGFVCLMPDHRDGSAPVVKIEDGSYQFLDDDIEELSRKGQSVEYVRARRANTSFRVDELVASLEVLLASNAENDSTASSINQLGLGFAGNLDTEKVVALGHSFGGATVLTMLARRPGLIKAVVAHEPAVDWMPDYGRRFLFPFEKMKRTAAKYSGGTGGYESSGDEGSSLDGKEKSKLFLFSKSWYDQGWGSSKVLECMHNNQDLGPQSDFGVIDCRHMEFSDSCSIIPLWLGRAVGITGHRSPIDTIEEIWFKTLQFLKHNQFA